MMKKKAHNPLAKALLPYFPQLQKKLKIAGIEKREEEFINWVAINSLLLAVGMSFIFAVILNSLSVPLIFLPFLFIIFFLIGFYFYMHYPDVIILKKRKELEYDIVFAVRHLVIALRAGMPLFDAIVGVTKGYGAISREFRKIVDEVTLGKPLGQALREAAETTPSPAFKRILLQIANALSSGSDVAESLEAVLDQISKEQIIALKEYGQKLNPIVMFYMIIGIIMPSLGMVFIIILLSFLGTGGKITLPYLLLAAAVIGLIQFLFLAMTESSRPKYAVVE